MAYTVTVTATTAGEDIGNFTIRQTNSSGTIVASNVTRAQLVAGFDVSVADSTTSIYVESGGICDGTNKTATITGTPVPVPQPQPVPAPVAPQPVPAPTVVPQPVPAPTVAPQPVPQPVPAPVAPQPVPVPAPTAPSLTDGWRFTAGTVTVSGTVFNGYHQGTLVGCPSSIGHGVGSSPTTATTALPGVDCYDVGGLFLASKGAGLNGVGNVSSYALTQFDYDSTNVNFGFINTSGTGNPGSGTLSGNITGDNGSSGTWSVSYAPGPSYIDNDGAGSTIRPESIGTVSLSGLTLTNGVTYTVTT